MVTARGRKPQKGLTMSPDVFRLIDGLKDVARDLNQESEGLNDLIERVDRRLSELRLGVEAEVSICRKQIAWSAENEEGECAPQIPATEETVLSYSKYSRWGLYVTTRVFRRVPAEDPILLEDDGGRDLAQCSRQVRVDALAQLPELISELHQSATEKLQTLRKAKSEVR